MKLAFIYLASGFGRRFGSNKLLYKIKAIPLYQYGFTALQQAALQLEQQGHSVKILVASQYKEILVWCREKGAISLDNPASEQGITASLKLGVKNAREAEALLFCVADQPYLTAATLVKLVESFVQSGKGLGCVACKGKRGNPAIFATRFSPELLALTGDKGGSLLWQKHPEDVFTLEAAAREVVDIDEIKDIEP